MGGDELVRRRRRRVALIDFRIKYRSKVQKVSASVCHRGLAKIFVVCLYSRIRDSVSCLRYEVSGSMHYIPQRWHGCECYSKMSQSLSHSCFQSASD